MRRIVLVCALVVAIMATGASLHLGVQRVAACTLGPFNASHLGEARGVDVAAIGTLGKHHGAAIELTVEEYYKAPPSKAEVLIVRNLLQTTTPSCEPVPTRVLAFEPGVRVIAILNRDTDGLGANWRPQLVRGLVPVRDGSIESFEMAGPPWTPRQISLDDARVQLAKLGPRTTPEAGRQESVPAATQHLGCLAGPLTVSYLAKTAPIIALGKVEAANPVVAQVRVAKSFLGPSDGELIKIDNRHYENTWNIGECTERAGKGPRFEVGQELLMFLRSQVPNDLAGYRGAGLDSSGIFFPTMPEPNRWSLPDNSRSGRSLEEAVALIETTVAARPALEAANQGAPSDVMSPAPTPDDRGISAWWLLTAAAVTGAGAGALIAFTMGRRWRR